MSTNTPPSDNSSPVVQSSSDVGFVPSRVAVTENSENDLSVATAATLATEYAHCPACGANISPSATDGVQSDRDVLWTNDTTNFDQSSNAVDRSSAHTCESCGSGLQILVEEKTKPVLWSEIPDKHWANNYIWIELEDNSGYIPVNPRQIMVSTENN